MINRHTEGMASISQLLSHQPSEAWDVLGHPSSGEEGVKSIMSRRVMKVQGARSDEPASKRLETVER